VQKSNSRYAPQPYTNQSVFKNLLNCTSKISLSRNVTGREFQRHGPATEKLLSPRRVCNSFCSTCQVMAMVMGDRQKMLMSGNFGDRCDTVKVLNNTCYT